MLEHPNEPANQHFIPFMPSVVDVTDPATPSMASMLDTLPLTFLTGGVIFFSLDMDEPQPVGSAAAMLSVSFHFCVVIRECRSSTGLGLTGS